MAYENETVRVERKDVATEPQPPFVPANKQRSIVPVVRKVPMKEANDGIRDLQYWLSQPVVKRAEAVTFLVAQMLKKGERMDKKIVNKITPKQ